MPEEQRPLTGSRREKEENWRDKVTQNLDYYQYTEEGQKEFAEMARAEIEAVLAEIKRTHRRIKDVIWLSKYCFLCRSFSQVRRGLMECEKHDARIVPPFYGKPLWVPMLTASGRQEFAVEDIDWSTKYSDKISEAEIQEAVEKINSGYPYVCFEPGRIRKPDQTLRRDRIREQPIRQVG